MASNVIQVSASRSSSRPSSRPSSFHEEETVAHTLVTFLMFVTRYLTKSNTRDRGYFTPWIEGIESIMVGESL